MPTDPWPDEPDDPFADKYGEPDVEPDIEAEVEEQLGVDIPDESEADPELFREFWSLVATINLGLFATSLGLLLVAFRGQWTVGGGVFLLGAASLAWAWWRYQNRSTADHNG